MSKITVTRTLGRGPCGRCDGCAPKDGAQPSPCNEGAVVELKEVSRRRFDRVPKDERTGDLGGPMVALLLPEGASTCSYGDIDFPTQEVTYGDGKRHATEVPTNLARDLIGAHGYVPRPEDAPAAQAGGGE